MTAQAIGTVMGGMGGVGGPAAFNAACEQIFQEYDPPIVCGTYSSVSRKRQVANGRAKQAGAPLPFEDQQSEHFLVNCAFQLERGGPNIPGIGKYSEGTAFSYNVYDDQSEGTEHKFLTDAARKFDETFEGVPTVADRLDKAEEWTKDSLLRDDIVRDSNGKKRSRIKDAESRTKEEKEGLAAAAARCLGTKAEQHMAKQGIKPDTPTRKGTWGTADSATSVSAQEVQL